jgi:hypothetical protein
MRTRVCRIILEREPESGKALTEPHTEYPSESEIRERRISGRRAAAIRALTEADTAVRDSDVATEIDTLLARAEFLAMVGNPALWSDIERDLEGELWTTRCEAISRIP